MFNQQKREPIKHTDSTKPDEVSVAVSRCSVNWPLEVLRLMLCAVESVLACLLLMYKSAGSKRRWER